MTQQEELNKLRKEYPIKAVSFTVFCAADEAENVAEEMVGTFHASDITQWKLGEPVIHPAPNLPAHVEREVIIAVNGLNEDNPLGEDDDETEDDDGETI